MEESNQKGWLKLYRKMLQWGWYDDVAVKVTFIHCLLKANIKEKHWHKIRIPPGGFVTSLSKLATETGLSRDQVRRALRCLQDTGEITRASHGNSTLIVLNNWEKFQISEKSIPHLAYTESHTDPTANPTPTHTTKEYKNIRNKEYKNIGAGAPSSGDILPPSPSPFLEDREIYIEKQEAQEMEKKAQPKLPEGTTEEQAVSFYGLLDAIMAGDYKEPEKEDTEQEEEDDAVKQRN